MSDDKDETSSDLESEQSGSSDGDFSVKKKRKVEEEKHQIEVEFSSSGPVSYEPITLTIKSTTPLSKLFAAFAEYVHEDLTNLRFLHEGSPVRESDTPQSLQLDAKEHFIATVPQQGG